MPLERYADVMRLRLSSPGSRMAGLDVSTYIVRGVMIDTGFHHVRAEVLEAVRVLGVEGVIVTHWHEDHAGNVELLARHGLPILMRRDTEETLRRGPSIALYRRVVWGHPPALASNVTGFSPARLDVLHTPGHAPDHQIVWDPETGTVFSGDLWLGVRARMLHAAEDPYEIVASLRRVAALGPARMFDAHRGFVDRPGEAIAAKIDWLSATLGAIERHVAQGWSDRAIVRQVLGGEELTGYVSRGDYARRNLVRAVRRKAAGVR